MLDKFLFMTKITLTDREQDRVDDVNITILMNLLILFELTVRKINSFSILQLNQG